MLNLLKRGVNRILGSHSQYRNGSSNDDEDTLTSLLESEFDQHRYSVYLDNVLISINPYIYDENVNTFATDTQYLIQSDFDSRDVMNDNDTHTSNSRCNTNASQYNPYYPTAQTLACNVLSKVTEQLSQKGLDSVVDVVQSSMSRTNQTIVLRGESGSGKSETAHYLVEYLVESSNHLNNAEAVIELIRHGRNICRSFGNARTKSNYDSSRFGTYFRIGYSSQSLLSSVHFETFFLEKSRLRSIEAGESSFHIFYQLISGLKQIDSSMARKLKLTSCEDFKLLQESNLTNIVVSHIKSPIRVTDPYPSKALSVGLSAADKGNEKDYMNDSSSSALVEKELEEESRCMRFEEFIKALLFVGLVGVDIIELQQVLASILHLGNVRWVLSENEDEPAKPVSDSKTLGVREIADFLGVNKAMFALSLSTLPIGGQARQSINVKVLSAENCSNNVNNLIKYLYHKLMVYLLSLVNESLAKLITDSNNLGTTKHIGVLDIFGYESTERNSLEQLCSNYANERLQQLMFEHLDECMLDEYMQDGIALSASNLSYKLPVQVTQCVSDLIGKRPGGLFVLLEEASILSFSRKPDDGALLTALNKAYDNSVSVKAANSFDAYYSKHRIGHDSFVIKHYMGDVRYSVSGFLVKNNETLSQLIVDTMKTTTNSLLRRAITGASDGLFATDGSAKSRRGSAEQRSASLVPSLSRPAFQSQSSPSARLFGVVPATTPVTTATTDGNNQQSTTTTTTPSNNKVKIKEKAVSADLGGVVVGGGSSAIKKSKLEKVGEILNFFRREKSSDTIVDPSPLPLHLQPAFQLTQSQQRRVSNPTTSSMAKLLQTESSFRNSSAAAAGMMTTIVRSQLNDLVNNIRTTDLHFIVCIKPNDQQLAGVFSTDAVSRQLCANGIVDIRHFTKQTLRSTQYSYQMSIHSFFSRYVVLVSTGGVDSSEGDSDGCEGVETHWRQQTAAEYVPSVSASASAEELRPKVERIAEAILPQDTYLVGRRHVYLKEECRECLREAVARHSQSHSHSSTSLLPLSRAAAAAGRSSFSMPITARESVSAVSLLGDLRRGKEEVEEEALGPVEEEEVDEDDDSSAAAADGEGEEEEEMSPPDPMRPYLEDEGMVRVDDSILETGISDTDYYLPVYEKNVHLHYTDYQQIQSRAQRSSGDKTRDIQSIYTLVRSLIRYVRNRDLAKRVRLLHKACREGDTVAILDDFAVYPDDISLVLKTREFGSSFLYHTAIRHNQVDVLKVLLLQPYVVLQTTPATGGNNLLHYAIIHRSRLEVIQYLADIVAMVSVDKVYLSAQPYNIKFKSGWLKKLGHEKKLWKYRWFTLTDTGIQYSMAPRGMDFLDFYPLDRTHASFRRSGANNSFQVIITLHARSSSVKNRSTLVLKASSEDELEEWVKYLTVSVRMEAFRENDPYTVVNLELRALALSSTNTDGNNCLHLLACSAVSLAISHKRIMSGKTADFQYHNNSSSKNEDGDQSQNSVKLAMWLIESGCPLDGRNHSKKSPLDITVEFDKTELTFCLKEQIAFRHAKSRAAEEYARVTQQLLLLQKENEHEYIHQSNLLRNSSKVRVGNNHSNKNLNGISSSRSIGKSSGAGAGDGKKGAPQFPYIPTPPRRFGYTYITIHFEDHLFDPLHSSTSTAGASAESIAFNINACPFLSVSVYNAFHELIEPVQYIPCPSIIQSENIYWGKGWSMFTPVENLPPASTIVIKYKELNRQKKKIVDLGWAFMRVDKQNINCWDMSVDLSAGEFDVSYFDWGIADPSGMRIHLNMSLIRRAERKVSPQNFKSTLENHYAKEADLQHNLSVTVNPLFSNFFQHKNNNNNNNNNNSQAAVNEHSSSHSTNSSRGSGKMRRKSMHDKAESSNAAVVAAGKLTTAVDKALLLTSDKGVHRRKSCSMDSNYSPPQFVLPQLNASQQSVIRRKSYMSNISDTALSAKYTPRSNENDIVSKNPSITTARRKSLRSDIPIVDVLNNISNMSASTYRRKSLCAASAYSAEVSADTGDHPHLRSSKEHGMASMSTELVPIEERSDVDSIVGIVASENGLFMAPATVSSDVYSKNKSRTGSTNSATLSLALSLESPGTGSVFSVIPPARSIRNSFRPPDMDPEVAATAAVDNSPPPPGGSGRRSRANTLTENFAPDSETKDNIMYGKRRSYYRPKELLGSSFQEPPSPSFFQNLFSLRTSNTSSIRSSAGGGGGIRSSVDASKAARPDQTVLSTSSSSSHTHPPLPPKPSSTPCYDDNITAAAAAAAAVSTYDKPAKTTPSFNADNSHVSFKAIAPANDELASYTDSATTDANATDELAALRGLMKGRVSQYSAAIAATAPSTSTSALTSTYQRDISPVIRKPSPSCVHFDQGVVQTDNLRKITPPPPPPSHSDTHALRAESLGLAMMSTQSLAPVIPVFETSMGMKVLKTIEFIEGVHSPVRTVMAMPQVVYPGMLIANIGGKRNRTVVVPEGVRPGEKCIVIAVNWSAVN